MNYAIILSGGTGVRLGLDIPKQYYEVNHKPIIGYVLDTLAQCDFVDGVVIVAAEEWQEYIQKQISTELRFFGFALPGENRQLSIYSGLKQLKKVLVQNIEDGEEEMNAFGNQMHETDVADAMSDVVVLIQDAARPNTSVDLYRRCFTLAEDEDGAMPVLPMKDTVYMSVDGKQVSSLLDRKTIFAGQAPESFRFEKYLQANESLLPDEILKINGSTEPAIMSGMNIRMIDGEEENIKITTEVDLKKFCEQTVGQDKK